GDNDEPWFLPYILANVRRLGDDVALGSVWFASEMKVLSDDHIPSTPYNPLVLRHAFEKDVIKRLMTDAKQDLDQEKQLTTSTFIKILNLLLAIGTGSYPFLDPLENDIEIDEPVLVVPTSSHTKRKEEIGMFEIVLQDFNPCFI
nr:asparagine synthetase [glutamine-hydrolyzing] 2 [Tanacetum cinerariifolium]